MKSRRSYQGFTIVELLIVIVVIAILSAISVVAYNGIQNRAHDAAVRSDLVNLSRQFSLYYADYGEYPSTATHLGALSVSINKDSYMKNGSQIQYNLVPCVANSAQEYSISAISSSGNRLYIVNGGGVQEYTGSAGWISPTNNYGQMCSSTLSGSTVIGSGAGWYSAEGNNGGWRAWTNG